MNTETAKSCKCCDREYTLETFGTLPLVGTMEELTLRNCPCGSTLAMVEGARVSRAYLILGSESTQIGESRGGATALDSACMHLAGADAWGPHDVAIVTDGDRLADLYRVVVTDSRLGARYHEDHVGPVDWCRACESTHAFCAELPSGDDVRVDDAPETMAESLGLGMGAR